METMQSTNTGQVALGAQDKRICVKDNLQPLARNNTWLSASKTVTVCLLSVPPLTANTVCFARLEIG